MPSFMDEILDFVILGEVTWFKILLFRWCHFLVGLISKFNAYLPVFSWLKSACFSTLRSVGSSLAELSVVSRSRAGWGGITSSTCQRSQKLRSCWENRRGYCRYLYNLYSVRNPVVTLMCTCSYPMFLAMVTLGFCSWCCLLLAKGECEAETNWWFNKLAMELEAIKVWS